MTMITKEIKEQKIEDLKKLSCLIRKDIVKMHVKGTNIGGAMSVTDILAALYFHVMNFDSPDDPERDRLVLSKGHCVSALYSCLSHKGFLKKDLLWTYLHDNSPLTGHPVLKKLPGLEASTGSLGHGLPIATGIAHSARLDKKGFHTYAVLGDGECQEGTVWEGANLASRLCLDNLTVIVDANKIQAYDRVDTLMPIKLLADKFRAFGFNTFEIDGHDHKEIINALSKENIVRDTPRAVIAHTTKGKGVSEMEDRLEWHYFSTPAEKVEPFLKELDSKIEADTKNDITS